MQEKVTKENPYPLMSEGKGELNRRSLFFTLMIAIKLDSPGPVFFKQKRVGIHKKHFYILKFRTMRTDTPKDMPTHLLKDPDQYITKVGKFLRKTSLDELPQIINILKGERGIIGTTKKKLDFSRVVTA